MTTLTISIPDNDKTFITDITNIVKRQGYELTVTDEEPYDKAFVDKVLQGDEDFKAGKGKKITLKELNGLWK